MSTNRLKNKDLQDALSPGGRLLKQSLDSQELSQVELPPSFVALFIPLGQSKPAASRVHISQRYELCEDLATLLVQTAADRQFERDLHETEVLHECWQGLQSNDPLACVVNPREAAWVVRRLAELLNWPALDLSESEIAGAAPAEPI